MRPRRRGAKGLPKPLSRDHVARLRTLFLSSAAEAHAHFLQREARAKADLEFEFPGPCCMALWERVTENDVVSF